MLLEHAYLNKYILPYVIGSLNFGTLYEIRGRLKYKHI